MLHLINNSLTKSSLEKVPLFNNILICFIFKDFLYIFGYRLYNFICLFILKIRLYLTRVLKIIINLNLSISRDISFDHVILHYLILLSVFLSGQIYFLNYSPYFIYIISPHTTSYHNLKNTK